MDLQVITEQLEAQTAQVGTMIQKTGTTDAVTDPEKMLQAQFVLTQYQLLVGYNSAVIDAFKTMIQGIISKI